VSSGRIVVGAAFIVIGGAFLIGAFTDVDAGNLVAKGWPLVLVALGVAQLSLDRRAAVGASILIVIGLLLLAFTTGVLDEPVWSVLWPVFLLLGGVGLVAQRRSGPPETAGDTVRGFAALSPRRIIPRSERLRGGEITALLGSVELDLTQSVPTRDARLTVTVLLGGCEIVVPRGWDVRISGIPLLGMWDDTTQRNGLPPNAPVLSVNAFVLLGGLEIRHPSTWK
jgi:hypothetical protein